MAVTLYSGTFNNSGAWSGGAGNWTYRLIIPITGTKSNGQIRLTVAAPVNGPMTVAHFSIGPWSGTKADMSQPPVEVTFGGTAGKAMAGGQSYVSDWVNCSFSGASKVVVVVDWSGNGGEYAGSSTLTGGGDFDGWNFSYDQQTTPVGLGDNSAANTINTVTKIETNDPGVAAAALLAGTSALTGRAVLREAARTLLAGVSTLTLTSGVLTTGAARLAGVGALTAAGFVPAHTPAGAALLAGAGSLRADATIFDILTAGMFNTSSPEFGTPAFASAGANLSANSLTTGSPVLGSPVAGVAGIGQVDLSGVAIRVGPVVDKPAVTAPIGLHPNPLTTSSPGLGTPALVQIGPPVYGLIPNALASSSPGLGNPILRQVQVLAAAVPLATSSPGLGRPVISGPGRVEDLSAPGLVTAAPTFGPAIFSQTVTVAPVITVPKPTVSVEQRDHHVRRSGDDYSVALSNLLPQGRAWPRDDATVLMQTVKGLAQIYGQVDGRAGDLLERESDARQTLEMLLDWERNWGLPDPCFFGEPQTIGARQKMLLTKMTLQGAQSRSFFIWAAAQLGYTITISEFSPFMVGVSHVGDTRAKDTSTDMLSGPFGIFG